MKHPPCVCTLTCPATGLSKLGIVMVTLVGDAGPELAKFGPPALTTWFGVVLRALLALELAFLSAL